MAKNKKNYCSRCPDRNTVEFLGIWEQIHNPDFKGIEFETFQKAEMNSYERKMVRIP